MHCRWRHAERSSCFLDRQKFAVGRFRFCLIARYFPLTSQTNNVMDLETVTVGSLAALAIEYAGDYRIRIMHGQAPHECNRILVGANDLWLGVRQVEVEFGKGTSFPAHCEMCREFVALDFDDDFLEQCSEQLLAVARRSRWRIPHGVEICSHREQALALFIGEHARAFCLAAGKFGLCHVERAQALLPLALKAAGNQPIVGINGAIAPLSSARLIARPLDAEPPLLEGRLAIGLKALGSSDGGGKPRGLQRCNESARNSFVDLHATYVETEATTPLDKVFAAAMVPRSRVPAAIVRTQATAAVAAAGETLQKCAAFSHGTT